MHIDPFKESVVIDKILKKHSSHAPIKLSFFDIDQTLTGNNEAAIESRKLLDKLGYVVAFVTARTEEMVMSSDQYRISRESYGFSRPPPKLGKNGNIYYILEPEKIENTALLNPDIIASTTGTRIFLKQTHGGYSEDLTFRNPHITPKLFRGITMRIISYINTAQSIAKVHPIEYESNYENGFANTYPPDFWIQVNFKSLPHKLEFLWQFKIVKEQVTLFNKIPNSELVLKTLTYVDNSDPDKNYFSIFILPNGGKLHAIDYLYNTLQRYLPEPTTEIQSLIAGDSWADLQMGIYGGSHFNKHSHLLLVGGSRLTPYLTQSKFKYFAGEPLAPIKNYLSPTEKKGYYRFSLPQYEKTVIIGDIAYPGTMGPETVLAFLKENN